MELTIFEVVEVDMDVEAPAGAGDVNAATDQLIIGEQIWHVRDVSQIGQKLGGRQHLMKLGDSRRKF